MHGTAPAATHGSSLLDAAPFTVGAASADPVTRRLEGPGGAVTVEPKVLQVLLLLVHAQGEVVTRDRLLLEAWRGRTVGDDAVNRVIGEIRRLARTVGGGSFSIETVPRAGYRLTSVSPLAPGVEDRDEAARPTTPAPMSRRAVLGTGAAVAAVWAVAGWMSRSSSSEAKRYLDEAMRVSQEQSPGFERQAVELLERAAAVAPDDSEVWGRLALAHADASETAAPPDVARAVSQTNATARRALTLDPRQPDARAALALVAPTFGAWLGVEAELRKILADFPEHAPATVGLATLLASVGRVGDSAALNLPLAARYPLAPSFQYRRVYALWNLGRMDEMDQVADRAMQLWPRHPGIWFVRLWTLAFTGRAAAALIHLDDTEARPPLAPKFVAMLRRAVEGIGGAGVIRAAAIEETLTFARSGATPAISGIMLLTALGATDQAMQVAQGYLRRQGAVTIPLRTRRGDPTSNDQRHRKTMMLFVPVTAPLRGHPGFLELARGIGLDDYWRRSGSTPDFLR